MKPEICNECGCLIIDGKCWCEKEVVLSCPQCGETVERLNEGYCDACHEERQTVLNMHNASFDFWESLTDKERDYYIRSAK